MTRWREAKQKVVVAAVIGSAALVVALPQVLAFEADRLLNYDRIELALYDTRLVSGDPATAAAFKANPHPTIGNLSEAEIQRTLAQPIPTSAEARQGRLQADAIIVSAQAEAADQDAQSELMWAAVGGFGLALFFGTWLGVPWPVKAEANPAPIISGRTPSGSGPGPLPLSKSPPPPDD